MKSPISDLKTIQYDLSLYTYVIKYMMPTYINRMCELGHYRAFRIDYLHVLILFQGYFDSHTNRHIDTERQTCV